MPSILFLFFLGGLLAYILYLRLQLHIHRRISEAFQNAAVVVPAASHAGPGSMLGNVILALLALGVFVVIITR